jgi:hypothetical protein
MKVLEYEPFVIQDQNFIIDAEVDSGSLDSIQCSQSISNASACETQVLNKEKKTSKRRNIFIHVSSSS